jgi:transcriptional regulator with XRE-family HTH domain
MTLDEQVYLEALGAHIRELRYQQNLSQEELARRAGVNRTHLLGVECGYRNVSVLWLLRIATVLGLEVADLVDVGN